jgi:hypothetical protein
VLAQAAPLGVVMTAVSQVSVDWIERVLVKVGSHKQQKRRPVPHALDQSLSKLLWWIVQTGLLGEHRSTRSSQRGDASLDSPPSMSDEPSLGEPTPLELTAQADGLQTPSQADLDIGTADATARTQRDLTQIDCLESRLYRLREQAITLRQKLVRISLLLIGSTLCENFWLTMYWLACGLSSPSGRRRASASDSTALPQSSG